MLKKLSFLCCSMIITAAAFSSANAQYWDDSTSDSSYDYDYGSDTDDSGTSDSSYDEGTDYDTTAETSAATATPAYGTSGSTETCPVCIHPVTRNDLYVDHNGSQINVCSGACIRRVKRNPDRYIKILTELGQ